MPIILIELFAPQMGQPQMSLLLDSRNTLGLSKTP